MSTAAEPVRRSWRRTLPLLAAAGLPALLGTAALVAALGGLAGFHPFWPTQTMTLSEAVALGDGAAVTILIEGGADPNARSEVGAGAIGNDSPLQLTPLEASISLGEIEIFRQLVKAGADVRGAQGVRIACLARLRGAPQILADLAERGARVDAAACEGVALPY